MFLLPVIDTEHKQLSVAVNLQVLFGSVPSLSIDLLNCPPPSANEQ